MANPLLRNSRFPHLLPQDVEIWLKFLNSPANIYSHFDYDVRVGDGRDPGTDFSEANRELGIMLSQRRIDAVGHHQSHLAIIEITRNAGLKALGQLIAYPVLYQLKFKPEKALKPILVAETMQTDASEPFHSNRIAVLLYNLP